MSPAQLKELIASIPSDEERITNEANALMHSHLSAGVHPRLVTRAITEAVRRFEESEEANG